MRRSVRIDDALYSISDEMVKATHLTDPSQLLAVVDLPAPEVVEVDPVVIPDPIIVIVPEPIEVPPVFETEPVFVDGPIYVAGPEELPVTQSEPATVELAMSVAFNLPSIESLPPSAPTDDLLLLPPSQAAPMASAVPFEVAADIDLSDASQVDDGASDLAEAAEAMIPADIDWLAWESLLDALDELPAAL